MRLLQDLFSGVEEKERHFLIGLLMGEIRQGALEGLVLEGIAHACSLSSDRLRQEPHVFRDIGEVARASLTEGLAGLSRFQPKLFNPISPMLANPVEEEAEALRVSASGMGIQNRWCEDSSS